MCKSLLFLILFFNSIHAFSQNYFQKIYKFEDSTALINDIVIRNDSSVLFFGSVINNYLDYSKAFVSEIDKKGAVIAHVLSNNEPFSQLVGFNETNSQTDFNGNYLLAYLNSFGYFGSTGVPRITIVDKDFNFIFDTIYDIYSQDSLQYFNSIDLKKNEFDSSFYFCVNFYDAHSELHPSSGTTGTMLFKIDNEFKIIWKKQYLRPKYFGNYLANGPVHMSITENNKIKLITKNFFSLGGTPQDWGKTHFYTLDTAGVILSHKVFQDTQYDISGNAYLPLSNGDIVATYFESQLTGTGAIQYYEHRPLITLLDSNLNQLWKDTLGNFFGNYAPYNSPSKILLVNDSTMVYAYENIILLDGPNYVAMRLESRNLNGTVNWQREYQYYDEKTEYQILDVEKFSNNDLIFAGQVINYDLINQNKSGQNGYVLKTNCLGFMGDPQANFSYTVLDSNKVQFVNLSAQAGSYSWHFGDGTLLQTGEKVDTVFHTFSKDSIFSVQLIAHGCNAIADTFSINLDFQKTDSVPPNFESLLTVYPNPLGSEELLTVYVGAISSKKHSLVLVDALGKKVATYLVPKANINLSFDVPAATGIYFLNLVEEDKVLVSRKVVVE